MGLRISRAVDTMLYGGRELEIDDLEGTYDHRIWFRKYDVRDGGATAFINVKSQDLVRDAVMSTNGDDQVLQIDEDIFLTFLGMKERKVERWFTCPDCGHQWTDMRFIPTGRFGFQAPRVYKILRNDITGKFYD